MYCGDKTTFWDCKPCLFSHPTPLCSVFSAVWWPSRGQRGSLRWLGMGRHWQWNAPCLQVRRPPTAPLLKQSWRGLWTAHTDGIKGMCEQHEHHREFKVVTLCSQGYHLVLPWPTNEQILFVDFMMQTKKAHVWTHGHDTHKTLKNRGKYTSCSTGFGLRDRVAVVFLHLHRYLLKLITYTEMHILQCQGVYRYSVTQRKCSCPMVM